jgi:excinuclease ABC subunit B
MPVSEKVVYRLEIVDNKIQSIQKIEAVSRTILKDVDIFFLFPAKHFITAPSELERALKDIKSELQKQLRFFEKEKKILEADRLKRRTSYDLAMIREIGYCNGIENYSRHFAGKSEGEPPDTLLSYFPHLPAKNFSEKISAGKQSISHALGIPDFLTIIDESHVTVPQIGGMYNGDQARKSTLVEHGFRLPSAKDNRPLKFAEFEKRVGQVIFTSATPSKYEAEKSEKTVEQVIRPTGLIDPEISVRPIQSKGNYKGQIQDFIFEAESVVKKGGRAIATTLTKKMAEDLSEYLKERKMKAQYLHSDIATIERIEILSAFRRGEFDVLVGVNLLREGLDLPEVTFIGILDADKEGFLRSQTSLIQIIGRAARNVDGHVTLYADNMTNSMERAMGETNRRRTLQLTYNKKHGITPKTIIKKIHDITEELNREHGKAVASELAIDDVMFKKNPRKLIRRKEIQMNAAVRILDFESAAILRDEIVELTRRLNSEQGIDK